MAKSDVEEWRPVRGWKGFYEVSSHGRVRSVDRRVRTRSGFRNYRGRVLRQKMSGPEGKEYPAVVLSRPGELLDMKVHRAVLETFVGTCPPGCESRHLDGDRFNPRLNNLAWGIPVANNYDDKLRHGKLTRGEVNGVAKLTELDVLQIRDDLRPAREIAEEYDIHYNHVGRIRRRERWAWL